MKQFFLTIMTAVMFLGVRGQEQKPIRRQADEHFMRYEYARAAVMYKDIAKRKKQKTDPLVIERLATCYRKMNKYSDAAEWYGKAVARADAAPSSFIYYGDMLKSLGRYDEAKAQYEQYASKTGNRDTLRDRIAGCDSAKVWIATPTNHTLENLSAVNSGYADWGGVYGRTGLLFTSDTLRRKELHAESQQNRRHYGWTLQDHGRLYAADTTANGAFRIRDLSPIMNRFRYHVGPLAFSRSYDTVAFTVTDPDDRPEFQKVKHWPVYGTRRLMMYYAVRKNGAWQKAIPFSYNKPSEYSVGHAAYDTRNDILYFASDMPGGKGGTDIWYCVKQPDGTLAAPQNCGSINTPEDEQFPTTDDFGNFYFASKGHAGMGGFDIFMTQGQKDQWSTPVNLHYPRNSPGDDFYYVTRSDRAVLSSNRAGGKGDDDIYVMGIYPPLELPGPVATPRTILQIKLVGSVCPDFRGACIYLYNKQRNIGWCFMPADGEFTAMLEGETDYVIRVYVGGVLRESIEFSTRGVQGPTTIQKAICPGKPQ